MEKQLLSQIIEFKKAGLSLRDACSVRDDVTARKPGLAIPAIFFKDLKCGANDPKSYLALQNVSSKALSYRVGGSSDCQVSTSWRKVSSPCKIESIKLRSPQNMLNFLGKIAEAYLNDGTKPKKKPIGVPGVFSRDIPLFVLRKDTGEDGGLVSTTYEGETYRIPAKENSLSMISLNLVSQLISLQKDPKNLPKSSIFNVYTN